MCELGGSAEEHHRQLGRSVAAANIDMLLTVGPQAVWAAEAALEAGMGKASVQRCSHARRMARLIKAMLHDEDTILVKGSHAVGLEVVVRALERYRGGRPVVTRMRHQPVREDVRRQHPHKASASAG
jgi:UDP-N-acetylmuramyl pentapeptide synthase